jgi:hypothetical protein
MQNKSIPSVLLGSYAYQHASKHPPDTAMNTTACQPHPTLSPHPVAQLWHAIAARWASHLEAQRKAHEFDFVADLSVDTLRDIGAPEHVVARALGRRESQQHRLNELRQWRGG